VINRILTNLRSDSNKFAAFIAGMGLRHDFRTSSSIAFIDALARLIAINGETEVRHAKGDQCAFACG
jgi:hypothetical protein